MLSERVVATRLAAFIVAPIIGASCRQWKNLNSQDEWLDGRVSSLELLEVSLLAFLDFMFTDLELTWSRVRLVSWIVEKIFGDENPFSKSLDSFSFTALFTNLSVRTMIADFFIGIPTIL